MIEKSYILRMIELITEKFTDNQISEIIKKEYNGLNISPGVIARRRDPQYIKGVIRKKEKALQTNLDDILELLRYNNKSPKSAKEITQLSLTLKGDRINSSEIDNLIRNNLSKQVHFEEVQQKYYLISSPGLWKPKNAKKNISYLDSFAISNSASKIIEVVRDFFKPKYISVNSGNKKIDTIITSIVKDNVITENEEIFLKQKAEEYGLDANVIEKAKKSLNFNNPYLDDLIHIIFDDGIIATDEIKFLKEKSNEHNFTKEFVNRRFWSTGFSVFLVHLIKINRFEKLLILIYLSLELKFDAIQNETWIFNQLDIYESDSLSEIIRISIDKLEKKISEHISEQKNINGIKLIEEAYNKIDLKKLKTETDIGETQGKISTSSFIKMIYEEKRRIGCPDDNLLVENLIYRINEEYGIN